jgi:succinyl-diaminopimelate desuccinylase
MDESQAIDRPELEPGHVAGILADLVRVRSVNPDDGEAGMARRVAQHLAGTRCEVTFVESLPGRPSVAAVLPGAGDGPRLVLNGHMDTVSPGEAERWSTDPFGGELRDGAVWGRGATDMKGGLACQLAVAQALGALPPLRGTLVLHFAVGEERGEPGTRSLIERGFVGDWGIVTEPTDLRVAIAQRGTAWYRVAIAGRSTHAGTRDQGDNPVPRLVALLGALARYDEGLAARRHPLLGRPICSPTVVRGGVEPNVIAESCEVIVDRRMVPGETSASVLEELRALVEELNAADPSRPYRVERHQHAFEPAEVAGDSDFVRLVAGVAAEVGGERRELWGTPWGSDVTALVNDAGMEAITFGPGDPDGCHRPDERCSVARLGQCAQALARVAVALLG